MNGPLNALAEHIHGSAVAHGFWDEERNFGELVALMHSELSEALEEHRGGHPDVYIVAGFDGKPEGVAVELADCLIRILDTLHARGVDIDDVVDRKITYNGSRPYKHGKAY